MIYEAEWTKTISSKETQSLYRNFQKSTITYTVLKT